MRNSKLSKTFSTTSKEFKDSKIFNTLTCNKLCAPLNLSLLRPLKTPKIYHRKIKLKRVRRQEQEE